MICALVDSEPGGTLPGLLANEPVLGPGGALEYGIPGPGGAGILVAWAHGAAVPVTGGGEAIVAAGWFTI